LISYIKYGYILYILYITNKLFLRINDNLCFNIRRIIGIISLAISSFIKYLNIVNTVIFVKMFYDYKSFIIVLCINIANFYPGLTSIAANKYDIFLRYGLCDWHKLMGIILANEVLYPIV
jgi:hypothetical protein